LHSNLAEAIKQTLKNPKCQIMAREDAPTSIEKEQATYEDTDSVEDLNGVRFQEKTNRQCNDETAVLLCNRFH